MNSMLSFEEVKQFLEANESEVEKLIRERKLQAYKIGGTYIRFRKEEVLSIRSERLRIQNKVPWQKKVINRFWDFWRFNSFYILSIVLVVLAVVVIIRQ